MKTIFAILLFIGVAGVCIQHIMPTPPSHTVLCGVTGNETKVTVAANSEMFLLVVDIGTLYNVIHDAQSNHEDSSNLMTTRSGLTKVLLFNRDCAVELEAKKKGLLVDFPVGTKCEIIQRQYTHETDLLRLSFLNRSEFSKDQKRDLKVGYSTIKPNWSWYRRIQTNQYTNLFCLMYLRLTVIFQPSVKPIRLMSTQCSSLITDSLTFSNLNSTQSFLSNLPVIQLQI